MQKAAARQLVQLSQHACILAAGPVACATDVSTTTIAKFWPHLDLLASDFLGDGRSSIPATAWPYSSIKLLP